MPTDQYLTIAEAVERYAAQGVTEPRLRRWIRTKRLPAFEREFDKTTMVKPSDVEYVLASLNRIVPKGED